MFDKLIADLRAATDDNTEEALGQPRFLEILANKSTPVTGVSLAGLITAALPSASTGISERAVTASSTG